MLLMVQARAWQPWSLEQQLHPKKLPTSGAHSGPGACDTITNTLHPHVTTHTTSPGRQHPGAGGHTLLYSYRAHTMMSCASPTHKQPAAIERVAHHHSLLGREAVHSTPTA
jgi:hypothetical protein